MPAAEFAKQKEPKFIRSSIVRVIAKQLEGDDHREMIGCWIPSSALRGIAAGTNTDCELYDGAFVPELVESFQWWIEAAECLLPFDEGEFPPDALSYRDRLIALESRFWEAVAPVRRLSAVYFSPGDERTDEPAQELVRRYLSYRDAACAYAREVLPANFCERLEDRV
jgi:hypothetical protein